MRNGKNGSKLLPVLVVILALILVACIGLLFWLEKGGELPARPSAPEKTTAGKQEVQTNPKPENTDPANTDNGTTGTLETSDVVIQTP